MAPRGRRGQSSEPQALHTFGVQGRKTGVVLPTGNIDDQGFQALDDIFSSPEKPSDSPNGLVDEEDDDDDEDEEEDGEEEEDDDDDSGSEPMDITTSAGPGPQTVLKEQRRFQHPPTQTRSPTKSSVASVRATSRTQSSPLQPDRDATVTRKLNFPGRPSGRGRPNGVNGKSLEAHEEDEEENPGNEGEDDSALIDSIMQVGSPPGGATGNNVDEGGSDEEQSVVQQPAGGKRKRGRPKTSLPGSEKKREPHSQGTTPQEEQSAKRGRGRPPQKGKKPAQEKPQPAQQAKRMQPVRQPSASGEESSSPPPEPKDRPDKGGEDDEDEDEDLQIRQPKKQRTSKTTSSGAANKVQAAPKPRGRPGRKPRLDAVAEDVGESSFMALQKGPPMPKRRGLVSAKRDPDTIVQTRSGRHSYRPLHYWAGDQVIREAEERQDMFNSHDLGFVSYSMKEIVRTEEEASARSKRAPRSRGRPKAKSKQLKGVEEEEEPEEWETDGGQVFGEVIGWEPEHEHHPPADDDKVRVSEEVVAISRDAVQTKDIKDATFRFAKTLTTPFMGAGVVDLPPGAEKRPKNSRKMHMVFFVHYGKVSVSVNECTFRISAGGQWFVARGNYYSIMNDGTTDARIFFSQACEVPAQPGALSEPPEAE